jgi:hypothetical protein
LAGPQRVEADDDERIDTGQQGRVEQRVPTVVRDSLCLAHAVSGLRSGMFRQLKKIGFLSMIQRAAVTRRSPGIDCR